MGIGRCRRRLEHVTSRVAALLLVAAAACGPRDVPLAASTPSATPNATAAITPSSSPAPTSSSDPMPTSDPSRVTFNEDATAAAPPVDIWATSYSNIVRHWSGGTLKEIALRCREANKIITDPRDGAIVTCEDDINSITSYRVTDAGIVALAELGSGYPLAVAPDRTQMVVWRRGDCPSPAPVCDARFMLRELASGAERVLLPNGYYLGASIGWTPLGLTYVQPECAEAGCAGGGDKGGTFVWDGTTFVRHSPLRLVAAAGQFRLYERGTASSRADASLVLIGPGGAVDLTPAGQHERGLSVNAVGEVTAVRGEQVDHALVRYDAAGKVIWTALLADGSQGTRVAGERYVVTTVYNMLGVPVFHIYDLTRTLRFQVALGDARVWVATAR
jgi:hypothetical protein